MSTQTRLKRSNRNLTGFGIFLILVLLALLLPGCNILDTILDPGPPIPPTLSFPTALPTSTQVAAQTPLPTEALPTRVPTEAKTPTPKSTPHPTISPPPAPAFIPQLGSPIALQNFFRADLGCNWFGVAGQIFDKDGQPVNGLVVEINGVIGGQTILGLAISGGTLAYGPGGYEIKLGDAPLASSGNLTIVVKDLQGNQLTSVLPVDTYQDCQKNLVLYNFISTQDLNFLQFLPAVSNSDQP